MKNKEAKMSKRKNLQKELVEKALGRGTEPGWEAGREPSQLELNQVLNYYNANHDEKDKAKWAASWIKKSRPDLIEAHKAAPLWTNTVYAVLMRLDARGLTLSGAHRAEMVRWAESLIRYLKVESDEEEAPKRPKRPKSNPNFGFFDDALECALNDRRLVEGSQNFEIDVKFDTDAITAYCSKEIEAINEEPECYPNHMKKWFKMVLDRLQKVEKVVKVRKVVTRKPRKIDPVKATKHVKFMKGAPELNLASKIEPSDLYGKKKALIYNTKWKLLIKVTANDAGFAFRGQALDNVVSATGKKVRKPLDMKVGGIRETERTYNLLTTKEVTLDKVRFADCVMILNWS